MAWFGRLGTIKVDEAFCAWDSEIPWGRYFITGWDSVFFVNLYYTTRQCVAVEAGRL